MKIVTLTFCVLFLCSCWKPYRTPPESFPQQKVWGSKPIYSAISAAKNVEYHTGKQPIKTAGNIYAYQNFIFQVDVGRGIHVIDNSVPASAERIGFIVVNGCAQISIRGAYLYTNSYSDLVTIDLSNTSNLRETGRVQNAFPDFNYNYPLSAPEEAGYYECPRYDSVVVGWTKDSIFSTCFKN